MQDLVSTLTDRERDVFDLVVEGYSNKEIAEKLLITVSTVKFHACNVQSKLGLHSRVGVILFGAESQARGGQVEFVALTKGEEFTEKDLRKAAAHLVELGLVEKKVVNSLVLDLLAALGGKI